MIIDQVGNQPVPRYLIYDIIKFDVSIINMYLVIIVIVVVGYWSREQYLISTDLSGSK